MHAVQRRWSSWVRADLTFKSQHISYFSYLQSPPWNRRVEQDASCRARLFHASAFLNNNDELNRNFSLDSSYVLPIIDSVEQAKKEHRLREYSSLLDALENAHSEFYEPPSTVSLPPSQTEEEESTASFQSTSASDLPTAFESPPLLPGFFQGLENLLGPHAKPTPIQALSIKWLIETPPNVASKWRQYFIAAETGSGKSIAYLLPLLQHLKATEAEAKSARPKSNLPLNPRGLILVPTQELTLQVTALAKALARRVPLRTLSVIQANRPIPRTNKHKLTTRRADAALNESAGEKSKTQGRRCPADILVSTPAKLLELVRGKRWDHLNEEGKGIEHDKPPDSLKKKDSTPILRPELGLKNVEWVVVDEADILLNPYFRLVTRTLLADISAARGVHPPIPDAPSRILSPSLTQPQFLRQKDAIQPINYPFNFILASATIPKHLARYLDEHHPSLIRLSSPHVHRLPRTLKVEYASFSRSTKYYDIERRIRQVWADDAASASFTSKKREKGNSPQSGPKLSKILMFCNYSPAVTDLAQFLEQQGIRTVAVTSKSSQRSRGTNKHLEGFLQPIKQREKKKFFAIPPDPTAFPHVMVATSLLSRGLDFSPSVRYVFVVDEPRSMEDFLHRAGRTARAGRQGNVVIYTKRKETVDRVKALLGSGIKTKKKRVE